MAASRRLSKGAGPGHDSGYKRLFSHPLIVEQLLRGFLQGDWIERLDFSTLQRVSNNFVSEDLRERHGDLIWRLRLKGEEGAWVYVYLLLEFQSTSDPFMAVRLLTYVGLLLEEIVRREKLKPGDRLPAVLPLVLYNGKRRWRAPLRLESHFVPAPKELKRYLPRLSYLLLDERRLDLHHPGLQKNPTAALFRIDINESPEALPGLSRKVDDALPLEDPELRRTVYGWFDWVARRMFPDAIIPEGVNLQEAPMLEETLIKWREQIVLETRRGVLLDQMSSRFGRLPEEVRRRVEQISSKKELDRLTRKILSASSLEDLGITRRKRVEQRRGITT